MTLAIGICTGVVILLINTVKIFSLSIFFCLSSLMPGIIQILLAHSGSVTVRPLVLVLKVQSSLQEQYNKDLTLKEAETIALSILKQVMEEKVSYYFYMEYPSLQLSF